MNDCNGLGVCNQFTGQCECNHGFKFADCSKKVIELVDDGSELELSTVGPAWFTMQYSGVLSSVV